MTGLIWLPLAIGWLGASLLALMNGRRRIVGLFAIILLSAMFGTLIALFCLSLSGPVESIPGGWPAVAGIVVRADPAGTLFAIFSVAMLIVSIVFEIGQGMGTRFLPALIVFLATALTGLFLTADLFNFYVFFELSMITSFGIASYGGGGRETRAALGFVIVNLIGTVSFLIGLAALYHLTGVLSFDGIANAADYAPSGSVLMASSLMLIALGLKLGVFPFQVWLPPVYRASDRLVAAILSGVVGNIGVYGILRLTQQILPGPGEHVRAAMLVIGIASMLYGGIVAFSQRDPCEMLAYSAIGQVGFIIVAIAVGGSMAIQAAIIYALVNALNKALLFLATELKSEWISAFFAMGAMSIAGIPPSAGFVAKVFLITALVARKDIISLAAVLIGTALSFFYVFRTYQQSFWVHENARRGSVLATISVGILTGLIVLLGIWPEPLLFTSKAAAAAFMERH